MSPSIFPLGLSGLFEEHDFKEVITAGILVTKILKSLTVKLYGLNALNSTREEPLTCTLRG